jgi:integrase
MINNSIKPVNIKYVSNTENIITTFYSNKALSYFDDDIWIFNKGAIKKNVKFNFKRYENKSLKNKRLFKEIVYTLTFFGNKKPETIMHDIRAINSFFNYVANNFKITSLKDINTTHSKSFINYVANKNKTHSAAIKELTALRTVLQQYFNELSWGFNTDPFVGVNINQILKSRKNIKENKQTEIINDKEWKQIIQVSVAYIEKYEKIKNNELKIHKEYIKTSNLNNGAIKSFNKKYKKFKEWGYPYTNRTEHSSFLDKVSVSAGILIQAFTGMRKIELMSLKNDCIVIENQNNLSEKINKIKGRTFKYVNNDILKNDNGCEVDWICPDIVVRAVNCLNTMNSNASFQFIKYSKNLTSQSEISYLDGSKLLFLNNYSGEMLNPRMKKVTNRYNDFIKNENINLDFKLTSHCFRRTLARFFAKSLLDMPVDILKEQFKHFSKDITFYYMKEDNKSDGDFINLIEGYKKSENKNDYFKEIKNELLHSIENANNVKELTIFIGEDSLSIVNEYMAKINDTGVVSPLECLTCKGVILLPDLHLDYWQDMLVLYDELLDHEPNSKWFKLEREQINKVVNKLKNNNAYIVGEKQ